MVHHLGEDRHADATNQQPERVAGPGTGQVFVAICSSLVTRPRRPEASAAAGGSELLARAGEGICPTSGGQRPRRPGNWEDDMVSDRPRETAMATLGIRHPVSFPVPRWDLGCDVTRIRAFSLTFVLAPAMAVSLVQGVADADVLPRMR